jgi:chromosomal replication initiation ATPase DnaA
MRGERGLCDRPPVTQRPSLKVVYLSSESFMNELIGPLRRGQDGRIQEKIQERRHLDPRYVQFIAGTERIQEDDETLRAEVQAQPLARILIAISRTTSRTASRNTGSGRCSAPARRGRSPTARV